MVDKTTTESAAAPEAELVVPTTWNTSEALRLDGDAVEKLATLGARASGVEIAFVDYANKGMPGLPDRFPIAIVHGDKPEIVDLKVSAEYWRTSPDRRRGVANARSLQSFIDLVKRHATEHSVVFADSDWTKPSLTAVIDYHDKDPQGFADNGVHRVRYSFPLSEEWQAWVKTNGVAMTQADFAAFVEDRIPDITAAEDATRLMVERDLLTTVATPAQLIQLARGLQVNVEAQVKNSVTLQSGEGQVVFEERHTGADGQPIKVPGAFVLFVAPFFRDDPVEVPVRLRYRAKSGALIWFYQLYRPDRVIAEAVDHAMASVKSATGLPVYEGEPEMRCA